jgi:hypothetical protein
MSDEDVDLVTLKRVATLKFCKALFVIVICLHNEQHDVVDQVTASRLQMIKHPGKVCAF